MGLELVITWVNRILFLKLLEAQLINYHKGDKSFAFLNLDKLKNYSDLNFLFFNVLACETSQRDEYVNENFATVPYLNSSLFEPTNLEHETIVISNLRQENLSIFSATVLKDNAGKKRTGELNALQYLFEFLDAYDFSSEGSEAIQEDNKRLINASVLGLIFEKINGNKESQRIQETLFHEKQTLIENCLFGVDINPNSVKICRLRLWIELLKNAYYKGQNELETLPNIDINIKCGNSLISRFELHSPLGFGLKNKQYDILSYQNAVRIYRKTKSKQEKRETEGLIKKIKDNFRTILNEQDPKKSQIRKLKMQLNLLENQTLLLEESKTDKKAREKKINKLNNEIDKLTVELEEIESGKIYENAFEWRFEFPEVLNNKGDFVGFDVIIGNPPYIRQEEIKALKPYLQQQYTCYTGVADLFIYFYEKGFNILKMQGSLTYISSNKYFRSGYGEKLRSFLTINTTIHTLIDFGDAPVFEEAIAYPSIIILSKENQNSDTTINVLTWEADKPFNEFISIITQNNFVMQQKDLLSDGWRLESSAVLRLLDKLRNAGTPLGEYVKGRFYRGVLTGFNEAFVIDRETRDRLIAEHPSSEEVLKPFLRGRDVKRWVINNPDLWLIFTRRGIDINQYPAILNHLTQYKDRLTPEIEGGRKAGNYQWYEIQDNIAYYNEFETFKIIYPDIANNCNFSLDLNQLFPDCTLFMIPNGSLSLLAILNSKVIHSFFPQICPKIRGDFMRFKSIYVSQIPIPKATEKQEKSVTEIVNKILEIKSNNPNADVSELEREIDQLVYELYGLNEEEIAIMESSR
ncbi:TaqI-like C-terminal specificity domain-containing protein [Crocosphaera sp. UHCC 0190]|nr:TaqI-like C-terminal specificity domain-containing protein [Crocosphaera sp. UHCC 0190]MEA5512343.1 TaqI-like C-terminal specificity domain-containing protein [Crocosphaera sp. UHCC 0190]